MVQHIAGRASIWDKVEMIEEHIHGVSSVYPTLASGVTVTATDDGGSWDLGTVVEIIPASTIVKDFDVHYIGIEDVSDNTVYELVLYSGAGDTEIGRVRTSREGGADGSLRAISIMTPIIAANSRIRAALATPGNNGETLTISLFYHTY